MSINSGLSRDKYGNLILNGKVVTLGVDCQSARDGMTKQGPTAESDIHNILRKYEDTGMATHINKGEPFFGDVSSIRSYQESLNVVIEARSLFESMPASVRDRFGNDPLNMIKFLDDPKNVDEAIALGIAVAKPEPDSTTKDVVKGIADMTAEMKRINGVKS